MTKAELQKLTGISSKVVIIAAVDFRMELYFPYCLDNYRDNLSKIIKLAGDNENFEAIRQIRAICDNAVELNPGLVKKNRIISNCYKWRYDCEHILIKNGENA